MREHLKKNKAQPLETPLPAQLLEALAQESAKFQHSYLWLERAMPPIFLEEAPPHALLLITHSLMGFDLQDYFSVINLKSSSIVLCLENPEADLKILRHFASYGIKNYQTYSSKELLPLPLTQARLRITMIDFMEAAEAVEKPLSEETKNKLFHLIQTEAPSIQEPELSALLYKISPPFLHTLPLERLALALHMLIRAQTRDSCQYEVRYDDDWATKDCGSMHIVLAWRNTPKHHFLFRLAEVIHRHNLSIKGEVNATYTDPYKKESVLILAFSLHGNTGRPVWEVADIPDFLRELMTIKYFDTHDKIGELLVTPKILSGNMGNLLRAMVHFIHQALVHLDPNLYTVENVEEALVRHPELTCQLCEAFKLRFDPNYQNPENFHKVRRLFLEEVSLLDTGQELNDIRRKNVMRQAINFISHTLKTNFYRINYTALCFRLDPRYLDELPFDRSKKFPELPYAIFFIKGRHFFGFHIRFKDLSRGGLRTIYPHQAEQMVMERNQVFTECYNLAWTQHKKNKEIPEGGAKGVILLEPFDQVDSDSQIYKREMEWLHLENAEIERKIATFRQEQKKEYLYQSQRAFIESLLTCVNCDPDGRIRARNIVDYWGRPEYLYIGPDENMHDSMIDWIAHFSEQHGYKPGRAFISSKPRGGINHKEYGVTSLGVNVYMEQVLHFLEIDPKKQVFTLKMSGGPDGDVAGNQLLNLYHHYPQTAKLLALTDVSGTINDPRGLDLNILKDLFYQNKGISFYPPEHLSEGGFLVNKSKIRHPSPYMQETLCYRKQGAFLIEEWLSGSMTNHLLRCNVHQTKSDIFIPAGGRPRTLNESNISEFLDESGRPTSKAIVEGANLYLTPEARSYLEAKGVLIVKDSSANKGGVICSSFEVLCGLALDEETFVLNKNDLVNEILDRVQECAHQEAELLLRTHQTTGAPLTVISDQISNRMNQYTYQLLDYLYPNDLKNWDDDPITRAFLDYCLPTLRNKFSSHLIREIPDLHKKAMVSCHIAAQIVYKKGVDWSPSIVDILPLILSNSALE